LGSYKCVLVYNEHIKTEEKQIEVPQIKKRINKSKKPIAEKLKETKEETFQKRYNDFKPNLDKFKKSQKIFILDNYVSFILLNYDEKENYMFLVKFLKEVENKPLSLNFIENSKKRVIKNSSKKKILNKHNSKSSKKYSMAEIDSMSGIEFEYLLKELFVKLNYSKVEVTKSSRDGGADLTVMKDNIKIVIQAKRYQKTKNISNSAIQEVISTKKVLCADKLMVITTAKGFTLDAKQLARIEDVELWDRTELRKKLSGVDLI
jgi:HJR/Mrr/RecB family endonuclease